MKALTPLQIIEKAKIKQQMADCKLCSEYKGWITEVKNGEKMVKPCECTILK